MTSVQLAWGHLVTSLAEISDLSQGLTTLIQTSCSKIVAESVTQWCHGIVLYCISLVLDNLVTSLVKQLVSNLFEQLGTRSANAICQQLGNRRVTSNLFPGLLQLNMHLYACTWFVISGSINN